MRSDWKTFCSTSRILVPCRLISAMISKMFFTKSGESPSEGSSRRSSFGFAIRPRAMASICCSPPDMVPPSCLWRSFKRGKRVKTRSMFRPAVGPG